MSTVPIAEHYRGVPIHADQPRRRIERTVKVEIDQVLDKIEDIDELLAWCRDASKSPEARILACAKIEAEWQLAAEERRVRPEGDAPEVARACTGGLNSDIWRSPTHYCCMAESHDRAVPREQPLR